MQRRDFNQLLALCAVAGPSMAGAAGAAICARGFYEKTEAESAAGAAVVDTSRCPGDWRRYGADPTGNRDSTAAIQAACAANSVAFDVEGGTYLVSGRIVIPSGVTVRGAGAKATRIVCSHGGISVFIASGATGSGIEKLKISVQETSKEAHTGAVEFNRSTNCTCRECEFEGCNWAGVLLHDSAYCTVDHCDFHDFHGAVQDSADIFIYNRSHHNSITNNRCFGGNWHGIAIQDPYSNSLPSNNTVAGNIVGEHRAYGILVYVPSTGDTFNHVTGNTVENIQGSVLENNSGAGIYVVGAGAGGTAVAGNTVRNCCVQTTRRSLAPAGIGVAGISPAAAPISVTGNTISDMHGYDSILIVSCKGTVTVSGNTATMPGNSTGMPIQVHASSNVRVTGNTAARDAGSGGRCIFVYANAIAVSNVAVIGNTCVGGGHPQIEFLATDGGSMAGAVCMDNICRANAPNTDCVRISGVANAAISGNTCLTLPSV